MGIKQSGTSIFIGAGTAYNAHPAWAVLNRIGKHFFL